MTRVAGQSPGNGAAKTRAAAEKAARRAQARSEGAAGGDTVTFRGEEFRLEPGPLPGAVQLILSHMSAQDPRVRDPDAEDGIWQILEMCLAQPSGVPPGQDGFDPEAWDPGEFKRFLRYYGRTRAPIEELVGENSPLQQIIEILAARPTGPPSGSSPGRPAITEKPTGTSSAIPGEVLSS